MLLHIVTGCVGHYTVSRANKQVSVYRREQTKHLAFNLTFYNLRLNPSVKKNLRYLEGPKPPLPPPPTRHKILYRPHHFLNNFPQTYYIVFL